MTTSDPAVIATPLPQGEAGAERRRGPAQRDQLDGSDGLGLRLPGALIRSPTAPRSEDAASSAEIAERRDAFLRLIGVKPVIMGILNVTPDSFSDGGRFQTLDSALAPGAQARRRRRRHHRRRRGIRRGRVTRRYPPTRNGAASSRCSRLSWPRSPLPFSIDTTKAEIARRAAALGVSVINDVWGLQKDPAMADVVAESGAAVVIMHNRESVDPDLDIEADIKAFLCSLAHARRSRRHTPRAHPLDPGVGFGKTRAQNLKALALTGALRETLRPADPDRRVAQAPVPRSARFQHRRPADRHARRQPCDAGARRVRIPRPRRRRARRRLQGVRGHRFPRPAQPIERRASFDALCGERACPELVEGAKVRGVATGRIPPALPGLLPLSGEGGA